MLHDAVALQYLLSFSNFPGNDDSRYSEVTRYSEITQTTHSNIATRRAQSYKYNDVGLALVTSLRKGI